MSEMDLDKDLASMAADLGGGDAGGDSLNLDDDLKALGEGTGDAGGDSLNLDDDLKALGGEKSGGAGDSLNLDDDLKSLSGEGSGGGGDRLNLDDDMQSLMNDSGGSSAAEEPGAAGLGGAVAAPARSGAPTGGATPNLDFLLDIKLNVTFEVGRSKMLVSDLLTLGQGSVIELHRLVGDELDFLINGRLVAKGEVVVVNEKFGCRITHIVPPEERVKHMGML
jgi:flagellar motor switch protein FliN/FliY